MLGKIKRITAVLFVFIFVLTCSTMTVSAAKYKKTDVTAQDNGAGEEAAEEAGVDTAVDAGAGAGESLEDISNIAKKQDNANNAGQIYVNEPLDNAVPMIYKYEIEDGGYIQPGEDFKIKFTIYNPAVVSKLSNIYIMVYDEKGYISPLYGSTNLAYVGYLNALSYNESEITMHASDQINSDNISVNFDLYFTDNYSTENMRKMTTTFPVSTGGKLKVESVDITSSMHVGTNNRMSITYANNGLSAINDVVLHIDGDNVVPQKISLGSIGGGSKVTSDAYLELLSEGSQEIQMYFTYNDNDGQVRKSDASSYYIEVSSLENEKNTSALYNQAKNRNNRYFTYIVLAISLLSLIIYVVCFVVEKGKKRLV